MTDSETITEQAAGETAGTEVPVGPSRGERLRRAREEKGLTVAEVAQRLNFEKRFITALENDNHEVFSGTVYVYGYMRAYAKLLNLPVNELTEGLSQIEEEIDSPVIIERNLRIRKGISPGWILFIALIILGIIAAWYLGQEKQSTSESTIESILEPMPESNQGPILEPMGVPEDNSLPLEEILPTEEDSPQDQSIAEPGPETETGIAQEEPAGPEYENTLVLEYSEASWTDIKDGDDKHLVYRLVREGARLELHGKPPFKILLGYAPGVTVKYNGEVFDHARYRRENMAYFIIRE